MYGVRNLEKRFSSILALTRDPTILSIAKDLLNSRVSLVRALFFDKTPEKNWYVTWHQDKTVTVNRKTELPGWGPWSIKEGLHHVQPPLAVLNKMITLRLHIDPSDEDNGCLKVIPGSYKLGILQQTQIDAIVQDTRATPCIVAAGDAVIMRPHLLHASSKARQPSHRRVVHLEYSSFTLPAGLGWA
ncbi:MAG: phytanoyl-CoA dioxygenase family protein [Gammaproteobacteria bacterium]|nr:phytanoyl-CoA dioxygenase family protein [Gammaproteobacteria bacterium]